MPRFVSVWLPAWQIERLSRADPGSVPDDKPFALVEKSSRGLIISAANDVALRLGIGAGQTLADVRAQIPTLAVQPAQAEQDHKSLEKLTLWLGRYGPNRNIDGKNSAWIDVTGVPHLFGSDGALASDLVGRLRRMQLTARLGIADTHAAAYALARYGTTSRSPFGLCPSGHERESLANLPVAALALDTDTIQLLRRLGLKRIGQLYGLPRTSLAMRFRKASGKQSGRLGEVAAANVLLRLDQALGHVAQIHRAIVEPPDAAMRLAFPEPLISSSGIESATSQLARMLIESLAARDLGACHYRLVLYRTDATTTQVSATISLPCREPQHLTKLLLEKMSAIDAGFGIDLMELMGDRLRPLKDLQWALNGGADPGSKLHELIDKLANRLGSQAFRLSLQKSYIPEYAQIRVPLLISSECDSETDWPSHYGRPAFLFDRPEPIEVVAEVPEGIPIQIAWRRVKRRISKAHGPERISPEWWKDLHLNEPDRPRTRDYFRLEDDTGAGYWCFRDGLYGREEERRGEIRWYMHGVFA